MTKSQEREDVKFIMEASEKLPEAFKELFTNMITEGMTGQEAGELSPELMENMYRQAYQLYNTGKYNEAIDMFRSLVMLNSLEFKYILGLAACFHRLGDYDDAIKTYTMCSVIDPNDPLPYYHSSDCFLQQQDTLSAIVCLKRSVQTAGDRPEFSNIKERSLLSLEKLKEELEAKKRFSSTEESNSDQKTDSSQI